MNASVLVNPVLVYSAVWFTSLLCITAGYANFMTPLTGRFLLLVAGNVTAAFIAYQVASRWTRRSHGHGVAAISPGSLRSLRTYSNVLFVIFCVGSAFNAVASGGLPIMWLLRGDVDRTYASYGLLTLTGLLAACGLFASLGYFVISRVTGTRRGWFAIAIVFIYELLILSRGGAVWLVLEMIGVYLQFGRFGIRRIAGGVIVILLVILLFGFMGDVRGATPTPLLLQFFATDDGDAVFSHLPSGFWWTYLYVSVGPVNLNAAMETVSPGGYPYWSVINLLPSFVRIVVYHVNETAYEARYPLEMANPAFNVFTLYGGYLADFGVAGCIAVTFVLHLLAGYYFAKAKRGDVSAIIGYAVCFQVITLSLFSDSLTSWVVLFQLVLAFAFRYFVRLSQHPSVQRVGRRVPAGQAFAKGSRHELPSS